MIKGDVASDQHISWLYKNITECILALTCMCKGMKQGGKGEVCQHVLGQSSHRLNAERREPIEPLMDCPFLESGT